MKVQESIWEKLTKVVYFLLVIAGLLIIAVWYLPVIRQNERMRKEVLRLDEQIQKQEEIGKQLRTSIDALKDPKAVERLARERLGYAKPGETVIRFESPPPSNSQTSFTR
jgi:cell division protein FtsB